MTAMARAATLLAALWLGACDRPSDRHAAAAASGAALVAPSAAATSKALPSAPSTSASIAPPTAATADATPALPPLPEPEPSPKPPRALLDGPPHPASSAHAGFLGPVAPAKDRAWIERLASAPITEIVRNKGGATITLRVRFADGQRAVLKPEQRHSASNLRAEIAAYHLDRIVGFGRTAVVVGRSVGFEHVRQHLLHVGTEPDFMARFDKEVVARDGRISSAVIAWHAGRLASAEPPKDWAKTLRTRDPVPPELERRMPEWSDLVVFDYLIDNTDRWSGGNVLSLGSGGPLIFLDNASGFFPWRAARKESLDSRLEPVCRFRRATIDALIATGPAAPPEGRLGALLGRSLARDALAPVLSERDLGALDARVAKLLAHVERCKSELGEDLVLSL